MKIHTKIVEQFSVFVIVPNNAQLELFRELIVLHN